MIVPVLVSAVVAFALAGLVGRWPIVVVPLIGWPVFFLGLNEGWWGYGLGDGWEVAFGLLLMVSTAAAAAGVAVRKNGLRHRAVKR